MMKQEALMWWNNIGSKLRVKYTSKYYPNGKYLVERNTKRIIEIYKKHGY